MSFAYTCTFVRKKNKIANKAKSRIFLCFWTSEPFLWLLFIAQV